MGKREANRTIHHFCRIPCVVVVSLEAGGAGGGWLDGGIDALEERSEEKCLLLLMPPTGYSRLREESCEKVPPDS